MLTNGWGPHILCKDHDNHKKFFWLYKNNFGKERFSFFFIKLDPSIRVAAVLEYIGAHQGVWLLKGAWPLFTCRGMVIRFE